MRLRVTRVLFALIPIAMISVAVPFVNQIEPRVFGLPFILAWMAVWVLVTPLFLLAIYRMEGRP